MEPALITLDTSGTFALLNSRDPDHQRVREALEADPGPYLVPAGALAEAGFLIERRLGQQVLDAFLDDLLSGGLVLDCGEGDLPRVKELVARYADLPLGLTDAVVIACAERTGGRVLTLDLRDFGVVAAEGTIEIVPGSVI